MSIFLKVTTNWRAGCKKFACPVRREGRSFLRPYPYPIRARPQIVKTAQDSIAPSLRPRGKRHLFSFARLYEANDFTFENLGAWLLDGVARERSPKIRARLAVPVSA
jgi:hypothetical protein